LKEKARKGRECRHQARRAGSAACSDLREHRAAFVTEVRFQLREEDFRLGSSIAKV
jgi:hypothetical protein